MKYLTHKKFSIWLSMVGAMIIYIKSDLSINYYVMLIMCTVFGKAGAMFPDVDHHWGAVKEKTTINWVLNKIIKITKGTHRSWQTHSIDIAIAFGILSHIGINIAYTKGFISIIDTEIIQLMIWGFTLGWISHLLSDMLTSEGVRIFFWLNSKIALVPKKLFKLRFNTGNVWERFVVKVITKVNIVIEIISLSLPFILKIEVQKLIELVNVLVS